TLIVSLLIQYGLVLEDCLDIISCKAEKCELGILPGHSRMVAPLTISSVRLKLENDSTNLAVSGGFLEVRPDKVTILAQTAEKPADIDVQRAREAKERAERRIQSKQ